MGRITEFMSTRKRSEQPFPGGNLRNWMLVAFILSKEIIMAKYDGWTLKTKRGALLTYYLERTRRQVIQNKIGIDRWKAWKHQGCKIVKVKLVEVK